MYFQWGLAIISLLFFSTTVASDLQPNIQGIDCGEAVVNRPELDASATLQACLDSGASQIRLWPGRYYLKAMLDLRQLSNLTVQTKGIEGGPACLSEGALECAVLVAAADHPGPYILQSQGAHHLTFKYIVLDGNIAARRARFGDVTWPQRTGYNGSVRACKQCSFIGFASVRAVQGTGLEFSGDDGFFEGCLFRDNGWDMQSAPDPRTIRFADGLTVLSSHRVRIRNSRFENNSDINLILGDAPDALVENNTLISSYSFAFAGLMLDNFNGTTAGQFRGAVVRKNKIDCASGQCGVGINVGPQMWYSSPPVRDGLVINNSIFGARQGILTNGAVGTRVEGNTIAFTGSYRQDRCATGSLSFSPGDQVTFQDNSAAPEPSQLASCSPLQLANLIHIPFGVEEPIAKLYRDIFQRAPDIEGGRELTRLLNEGRLSLSAVREAMAISDEARTLFAQASQKWLKRSPSEADFQAWGQFLAHQGSFSRWQVLLQMSDEALQEQEAFKMSSSVESSFRASH